MSSLVVDMRQPVDLSGTRNTAKLGVSELPTTNGDIAFSYDAVMMLLFHNLPITAQQKNSPMARLPRFILPGSPQHLMSVATTAPPPSMRTKTGKENGL
jgi:hypothetical protein